MKVPMHIDTEGNNCGYYCPFKETSGPKGRDGHCLLFRERLTDLEYYGAHNGFRRCERCLEGFPGKEKE